MELKDEDLDLILQFKEGNKNAFEEIIKKYKKIVINVAYNFVYNTSDAEEIAQEVFIKIYQNIHKFNPKAKFKTWVYKITSNLCINVLKKKKIHSEVLVSDTKTLPANKITDSASLGDNFLIQKELSEIVRNAIFKLSPRQRLAILLQYYEDMSLKEIGESLSCSSAAAGVLLQRARESLQKILSIHLKDIV
ncbi:MAG: sigma-70 family RNA polymerase sigma factor [Candidatus Firestonebacteria bacterium]